MKSCTCLILVLVLFGAEPSFAQPSSPLPTHPGKIGLGLDGITGSPNVLLVYFFNAQMAGQLIVGYDLDFPGGTAATGQTKVNGATLRGGFSLLFHLTKDQVSPYVGFEGIFQTSKQSGFFVTEPDSKNSIIAGAVFGAEYFMNEKFSLGIKQTLGVDIQLKRDIPKEESSASSSSSTVVTGRYYFN